jgi:hypothetical protein
LRSPTSRFASAWNAARSPRSRAEELEALEQRDKPCELAVDHERDLPGVLQRVALEARLLGRGVARQQESREGEQGKHHRGDEAEEIGLRRKPAGRYTGCGHVDSVEPTMSARPRGCPAAAPGAHSRRAAVRIHRILSFPRSSAAAPGVRGF